MLVLVLPRREALLLLVAMFPPPPPPEVEGGAVVGEMEVVAEREDTSDMTDDEFLER